VVVSWLRVPVVRPEPEALVEPPRRRVTDTSTEGLDAVLPFDADER
jgi:hypothetical protein